MLCFLSVLMLLLAGEGWGVGGALFCLFFVVVVVVVLLFLCVWFVFVVVVVVFCSMTHWNEIQYSDTNFFFKSSFTSLCHFDCSIICL